MSGVFFAMKTLPSYQFPYIFMMLGSAVKTPVVPEVLKWCEENIGERDKLWKTVPLGDIQILRETDAFAFKLRWL
jgi:hypothetical protein